VLAAQPRQFPRRSQFPAQGKHTEPGLNRIIGGESLNNIVAHDVAQRISIPPAATENGLLAPGTRIARRLRRHPAGLAPQGSKQTVQEQAGRSGHPFLCEQGPYPRLHIPQRRRPKLQRRFDQGARHP
jgi:hypothetical protein